MLRGNEFLNWISPIIRTANGLDNPVLTTKTKFNTAKYEIENAKIEIEDEINGGKTEIKSEINGTKTEIKGEINISTIKVHSTKV